MIGILDIAHLLVPHSGHINELFIHCDSQAQPSTPCYDAAILNNMGKKPLDLIAIGESLRDAFYMIHDATLTCSINKDRCLLCLEYSEKIPVDKVIKVPAAGNSANAAVSCTRLGLNVALVTWVGRDKAGDNLRDALCKEGINEKFIQIDPTRPTSESTIMIFQGEKTQLVYFEPRSYKIPRLPAVPAIYYSAMGKGHQRPDKEILRQLKAKPKTFFAFQPGTTHIRSGLEYLKPLIARSDLFILNKDEAHFLLGDGERPMMNILEGFHHLGAKRIIVTDSKKGADAYDGTTHWHMPIFPGKSIETTGAGDAFASAVTAAHLLWLPLPEALRWGAANSLSVVQKVGPQAGLLKMTELKKQLKKFSSIKAIIVPHKTS